MKVPDKEEPVDPALEALGKMHQAPAPKKKLYQEMLEWLESHVYDYHCEYHGDTLSHGPDAPEVISGEWGDDWCGCEQLAKLLNLIERAKKCQ